MFLSRKMKGLGVAALLLSVALSGCSNGDPLVKPALAVKPTPLQLDFFTMPLDIKVGKQAELRLSVKRDGKVIQDATCEFEVWRDCDAPDKHEKLMVIYGLGYYFTGGAGARPGTDQGT